MGTEIQEPQEVRQGHACSLLLYIYDAWARLLLNCRRYISRHSSIAYRVKHCFVAMLLVSLEARERGEENNPSDLVGKLRQLDLDVSPPAGEYRNCFVRVLDLSVHNGLERAGEGGEQTWKIMSTRGDLLT